MSLLHLKSLSSSQIIDGIRLGDARVLTIVVVHRYLRLVAYVAEQALAFLASDHIFAVFLSIDRSTAWAFDTEFHIDVGILSHPHESLN